MLAHRLESGWPACAASIVKERSLRLLFASFMDPFRAVPRPESRLRGTRKNRCRHREQYSVQHTASSLIAQARPSHQSKFR